MKTFWFSIYTIDGDYDDITIEATSKEKACETLNNIDFIDAYAYRGEKEWD